MRGYIRTRRGPNGTTYQLAVYVGVDERGGQENAWGIGSSENAWGEFVPFLEFPIELHKIGCTTNAIERLNARFRWAARHQRHFTNEQVVMKVLYFVARTRR